MHQNSISPYQAIKFLWQYVKKFKVRFFILLICMVIWAINEAVFPYFIKVMVNIIEHSQPHTTDLWQTFKVPILALGSIWLAMEIAMRTFGLVEVYLYPQFRASIRGDFFSHIQKHGLEYFSQNLSGSIGSKIADAPRVGAIIVGNIIWAIIPFTLAFVFSTFIVAQVSLIFTALMVIWCFFHFGITFYFLKSVDQRVSTHYESIVHLNGETVDTISNATIMRLFSKQSYESKRLHKYQLEEIDKSKHAGLLLQKVDFFRGAASLLFLVCVIYFLLIGWKNKSVSTGDFPLIAVTAFNIMGIVWQMTRYITETIKEVGALNGTLNLLKHIPTVVDLPNASCLKANGGQIIFENVCFGYRQDKLLFKSLSIMIQAGEKIGLVGFSGSGKTSFINLLLREYDVLSGQITIDGQNIAHVTQNSLRQNISVIPQEPQLFNRSVLENLSYGQVGACHNEIIKAAQKAYCHDFIVQLDHEYQTFVGEKGSRLSGGQRQRLAIARAMLKDAPILIMDEATSALDSSAEKLIQESLAELMIGKTTLVIAHRLKTLEAMDRILVFDKGSIVEQGTIQELLRKKGVFSRLWSLQNEGFLNQN